VCLLFLFSKKKKKKMIVVQFLSNFVKVVFLFFIFFIWFFQKVKKMVGHFLDIKTSQKMSIALK
jgi:hypothetical protein